VGVIQDQGAGDAALAGLCLAVAALFGGAAGPGGLRQASKQVPKQGEQVFHRVAALARLLLGDAGQWGIELAPRLVQLVDV